MLIALGVLYYVWGVIFMIRYEQKMRNVTYAYLGLTLAIFWYIWPLPAFFDWLDTIDYTTKEVPWLKRSNRP
jgi:hypothetical protein